jgi:hypothetical protein
MRQSWRINTHSAGAAEKRISSPSDIFGRILGVDLVRQFPPSASYMAVKILFLDIASISPTVKQGHIMEEEEIEGNVERKVKKL